MRQTHIHATKVEKSKAKMMAIELENMEEKLEILKQQKQFDEAKKSKKK